MYPHVDLQKARAVLEQQHYPQAGENNPDVRVGVVAVRRAARPSGWMSAIRSTRFLIARAGWVADSKNVYVVRTNRIQNQLEFLLYDVASGKARTAYRESDNFWVNVEGDPVFLKDGKHFLWTSERDGFRHLYLYSLDGGAPQQLTKGEWEVTDVLAVRCGAGLVSVD